MKIHLIFSAFFSLLLSISTAHAQMGSCTLENIAAQAATNATSTYFDYAPEKTNDGDISTELGGEHSWSSARVGPGYSQPNASLFLTFNAPKLLRRVVLFTTESYALRDYDVQLLESAGWTTVAQVRGNTGTQVVHDFPERAATRVRILGLRGPNHQPFHIRVNELQVEACKITTGNVSGFINRFAGGGLAATVSLGNLVTTSNAVGFFTFANVPNGSYALRVNRPGWTFGSPQFLDNNFNLTVNSNNQIRTMVGYDRNPIVYAHGWTDNIERFSPVRAALRTAGYLDVQAPIQTSFIYTPSLYTNALNVRTAIDSARYTTGQNKVILLGHSMGGLVARAYTEGGLYRRDVSRLIAVASPHLGTPLLFAPGCVLGPGVCEMTVPGMLLFNLTHFKRAGVAYHVLAGDAPMWRPVRWCFTIFGTRFCGPWIYVPDFSFRNGAGWFAGLVIAGPDDGFVQTFSAFFMPGNVDRFRTQEVHTEGNTGYRDAFSWEGGLSQQGYEQCLKPLLVTQSISRCGSFFRAYDSQNVQPTFRVSDEPFAQHSRAEILDVAPGKLLERDIWIDGSPTLMLASWSAGRAEVTLIDPSGQRFDKNYADEISAGEASALDPIAAKIDPNAVLYAGGELSARFQFLAPRPGRWKMQIKTTGEMKPDAMMKVETNVQFDSSLAVAIEEPEMFQQVAAKAMFKTKLGFTATNLTGELRIARADGVTDSLRLVPGSDGNLTAAYLIPDAPGTAALEWFVRGMTAEGKSFERAATGIIAISKATFVLNSAFTERPIPQDDAAASPQSVGRFASLTLSAELSAQFAGDAMVGGRLVDARGDLVATASSYVNLKPGSNRVTLTFDGPDIFEHGANGPYRLSDLVLIDQTKGSALSARYHDQHRTAAYDFRSFQAPTVDSDAALTDAADNY